tara:strand:+ start:1041 stop:1409 length:369 start_codon:yes stop_codon:yes gene_type:complete
LKIFWLLFTALMVFRPVAPLLDYMVNYDYIADELCVNRDRPELNCNGRCYLMNALAEEASKKKDAQQREGKLNFQLSITYFVSETDWSFELPQAATKTQPTDHYLLKKIEGFTADLLKPPIS